ncbi:MAG: 2-succinyl-6-hydroxy-2,4-cyclohexadiene-1-carboxy late synthase [Anaerolineales bacterium]
MSTPWFCLTLGRPEHPPLILLHGFMGSGEDFLPLAERLARRFFCILPDLPGHGNSPLPEAPLSFELLYGQFQALLAAYEIETFTLGGYSMGGRLALYFAVQLAHRVGGLLLESTNAGLSTEAERRARLEVDRQRAVRMQAIGMAAFLREWYAMPLFASLQRRPQVQEAMIARRSQMTAQTAGRLIVELSPGNQPPLWDALPTLSMPALLLAGELDPKYPALMARMAAQMPRALLTVVEQAGHNVHAEKPHAWLRAVTRHLRV